MGLAMVELVGRAGVPAGAGMDVDVAGVARAAVVVEMVEMVAVVARAAVGWMVRSVAVGMVRSVARRPLPQRAPSWAVVGGMVRSVAVSDRSAPEHLARTDSRLVRDSLGLSSDSLC